MKNNNMQPKTEQANPTIENMKMRWEKPELILLNVDHTKAGLYAENDGQGPES